METILYNKENAEKLEDIIKRKRISLDDVIGSVRPIISQVRKNGDSVLFILTRKLDKFNLSKENIRVSEREIREAYSRVNKRVINALEKAAENIGKYHAEQYDRIEKEWGIEINKGVLIKEKIVPIKNIGCYIPGGRASYPSTVLMTCIPAKAAGVERVVIVSPPPISDVILVAADICNVREIYRVGGAQAIAALAYGTESIPRVDKIVGPGNKYVMAAKMLVYGQVDIDMPAGPSEILIIADDTAKPKFIAADILAQLEHDPNSYAILVTHSKKITSDVENELQMQMEDLKDLRRKWLTDNLQNYITILTKDIEESIEFANLYAPEHIEIMTENPENIVNEIRNAGAIFLGDFSPVAAGDYASGGNHVLPTGGTARFASELSVRDFIRNMSIQNINNDGLRNLRDTVEIIAETEGFIAHKKSIEKRFEYTKV